MTTVRRGIGLTPMETRRDVIVRMAILADELGYEMFILPEGWGFDSTLILTEIALKTERIRLMSGILSVWGRTPGTIAMNAATLDEISGGRHILGLGPSTKALVEGFHGIRFERPARKLREVTEAVQGILAGERVNLPDDIAARPLRLGQRPRPELPIYIAAMGKYTVPVAAELADGWFPIYVTRDRYAGWMPELSDMRKRAGIKDAPLTVLAFPGVAVSSSESEARQVVANNLAWYLCAMGDVYARFVASQGFEEEVEAVLEANPKPSPSNGVIPKDAQILLDQLTIYGPPEKVAEGIAQWDDAVDVPIVSIAPGIPWDDIEAIVRAAAP